MIEPKQATIDGEELTGILSVDENNCGNWKLIETLLVDNSGFGQDDEPALTIEQFYKEILAGRGYGVIDAGQFQVQVGVFERGKFVPKYWIDDDGCIAYGHGDDYITVAEIIEPEHIEPLTKLLEQSK